MIGLDTNVLLRFFMKDDPVQWGIAARFLEEQCTPDDPGYINHIVLCEMAWVLRRNYGVPREGILSIINEILQTDALAVQSPGTVFLALRDCEAGLADFPDCLLAQVNGEKGCLKTVTFDVAASRGSGMELLV